VRKICRCLRRRLLQLQRMMWPLLVVDTAEAVERALLRGLVAMCIENRDRITQPAVTEAELPFEELL
jgi:hypothetical protein